MDDLSEKGYHFASCLKHALTKGVDSYASDTTKRASFVEENQHLFAGTMLVAMFSYLESTLGKNWISRCGGRQTRELFCLRFARNAFVHANSHIRDLSSYSKDLETNLEGFIDELKQGNIKDDKGNAYPVYMSLSQEGVITFNKDAIQIFYAITKTLAH